MALNGWKLTGKLVSKHFSVLGDKIAQAIAGFDPETATEADRERLQQALIEAGSKLSLAKSAFNKEQKEADELASLIASDTEVASKLLVKLEAGEVSEDVVTMFADELEQNKSRLPIEQQEAEDAKIFLDQVQDIVDQITKQLTEFDAIAKKAIQQLNQAKAQQDLQQLRVDRQAELSSLNGLKQSSSALAALSKQADKVKANADGLKTLADVQQKPLDTAKQIQDIRSTVSVSAGESPAQRLARIAGK